MKRVILLFLICALLLTGACGRSRKTAPAETAAPEKTSAAPETATGQDDPEAAAQEDRTEPEDGPAGAVPLNRVEYGADTGTDKTYTGLEPLPERPHALSAMRTGLSEETIEHSFGVAKDGRPHAISVEAQKRFDENGLDALVYDNRAKEKTVYLTFDCGYDNGQTEKILDTLQEKGVKAAFFCTKPEMESVLPR